MNSTTLKERAQRGIKLDDILVIDSHTHFGGYPWQKAYDTDFILRKMDRIGVNKACISSLLAVIIDFDLGNKQIDKLVKEHPDRFFGYCVVNPHYPQSIEEMDVYLNKPGFIGVKIHPHVHKCPVKSHRYKHIWETSATKGTVVLSHTEYPSVNCDPLMFGQIAKSYPSVPIILGHSGVSPEGFLRSIEVAKSYNNIYLELCNEYSHHLGEVEYAVKSVGSSRVLFGSDFACEDIGAQIGPILFAEISEDEKRNILGLNIKKLLEKIQRYR